MLADVPPARLFDECGKLFLTGHGVASLRVLREHGLLSVLLPGVDRYLRAHAGGLVEQLLVQGLTNTDARVAADKPVTPTYLFALLLYGPIAAAIEQLPPQRWHEPQAILEACDRALREAQQRVTIPKRIAFGVRDLFALQPRLEHPRGKRALRLLEQPRFRAAFDLLTLRASLGLASAEVAQWWHDLQQTSAEQRERLVESAPVQASPAEAGGTAASGRRRRRRRRSSAGANRS
jgi:poly(A) polymerase